MGHVTEVTHFRGTAEVQKHANAAKTIGITQHSRAQRVETLRRVDESYLIYTRDTKSSWRCNNPAQTAAAASIYPVCAANWIPLTVIVLVVA